jgi:hypothetical protein
MTAWTLSGCELVNVTRKQHYTVIIMMMTVISSMVKQPLLTQLAGPCHHYAVHR